MDGSGHTYFSYDGPFSVPYSAFAPLPGELPANTKTEAFKARLFLSHPSDVQNTLKISAHRKSNRRARSAHVKT